MMRPLLVFMACLALCSCAPTRYIPVESVRTEYRDKASSELLAVIQSLTDRLTLKERQADSLMQSNRELLVLSEAGDTLRHDREVIVYRASHREKELERLIEAQRDSIRELSQQMESIKADSVPVPYPAERKLSRWEQAKMDFGGEAMVAVAVMAVAAVVWLVKRFRR